MRVIVLAAFATMAFSIVETSAAFAAPANGSEVSKLRAVSSFAVLVQQKGGNKSKSKTNHQ